MEMFGDEYCQLQQFHGKPETTGKCRYSPGAPRFADAEESPHDQSQVVRRHRPQKSLANVGEAAKPTSPRVTRRAYMSETPFDALDA